MKKKVFVLNENIHSSRVKTYVSDKLYRQARLQTIYKLCHTNQLYNSMYLKNSEFANLDSCGSTHGVYGNPTCTQCFHPSKNAGDSLKFFV